MGERNTKELTSCFFSNNNNNEGHKHLVTGDTILHHVISDRDFDLSFFAVSSGADVNAIHFGTSSK